MVVHQPPTLFDLPNPTDSCLFELNDYTHIIIIVLIIII